MISFADDADESNANVSAISRIRSVIDIDAIKRNLIANHHVREKLQRDFGLSGVFSNQDMFIAELIANLGQTPLADPLECSYTNANVFRAAVRALGSNSRKWSTFIKNENALAEMLGGYDPIYASNAIENNLLNRERLASCLGGQTETNDADAILHWAKLLAQDEHYYDFIKKLGGTFQSLASLRFGTSLTNSELMLCIVGYIGNPPKNWEGEQFLGNTKQVIRKTPGMSYVLASEFMRNLGWEGFKPDRHVMRLFDLWLPEHFSLQHLQDQARRIAVLIGRNDKNLNDYLKYSLIGADIAPRGTPLSHVDNLVWLLGAYVEKKGHESNSSYLRGNS
jgi:hypothetical protein